MGLIVPLPMVSVNKFLLFPISGSFYMTEGDFKPVFIDSEEFDAAVHVTGCKPPIIADLGMEVVLMWHDQPSMFAIIQWDERGSGVWVRFLPYRSRMEIEQA
nr:MAG TPA: hypothetical protein [Caudoviricetes sp.]